MIKLHHPDNEIELALLRSLLEAEQIPHYVHNDHFGTLRTGPRIPLLNRKTIMVAPQHADTARALLAAYLESSAPPDEPARQKFSLFDKLRMAAEMLLFGWFIPGNRWTERRKPRPKTKGR